ncbi:hypothetical protein E5D57_003885 [Metarhizium anisopliae]|nr:hypothetical protein E5D57_003885 [Metarhizium anisopliae]
MKLTAVLVIASAISVHCQASNSTSRSSTITAPPTARPTTSVRTTSRTTSRTNTTVVAAGPNPVAPGLGLAALMALGALV